VIEMRRVLVLVELMLNSACPRAKNRISAIEEHPSNSASPCPASAGRPAQLAVDLNQRLFRLVYESRFNVLE